MSTTDLPAESNEFPGWVAFDFRFTIPVSDAEYVVRELEYLAAEEGWELSFPPGDSLPHEHTLPSGEALGQVILGFYQLTIPGV